MDELRSEMLLAAEQLEFEKAAELRDRIKRLESQMGDVDAAKTAASGGKRSKAASSSARSGGGRAASGRGGARRGR
jgi:excinuclease ABC subunit B